MRVILRTERLVLRRFEPSDGDDLATLLCDPEVMRFIALPVVPRSEVEDRELPAILAEYERYDDYGYWAAVTDAGEFIGRFGLHPAVPATDHPELWTHGSPDETSVVSLGYRLRRPAWGAGYATEGAAALVDRAFTELGATQMCATTMAVNSGSRRVLEKLGFRHTATVHLNWPDPLPGNEYGDVIYRLDRGSVGDTADAGQAGEAARTSRSSG